MSTAMVLIAVAGSTSARYTACAAAEFAPKNDSGLPRGGNTTGRWSLVVPISTGTFAAVRLRSASPGMFMPVTNVPSTFAPPHRCRAKNARDEAQACGPRLRIKGIERARRLKHERAFDRANAARDRTPVSGSAPQEGAHGVATGTIFHPWTTRFVGHRLPRRKPDHDEGPILMRESSGNSCATQQALKAYRGAPLASY